MTVVPDILRRRPADRKSWTRGNATVSLSRSESTGEYHSRFKADSARRIRFDLLSPIDRFPLPDGSIAKTIANPSDIRKLVFSSDPKTWGTHSIDDYVKFSIEEITPDVMEDGKWNWKGYSFTFSTEDPTHYGVQNQVADFFEAYVSARVETLLDHVCMVVDELEFLKNLRTRMSSYSPVWKYISLVEINKAASGIMSGLSDTSKEALIQHFRWRNMRLVFSLIWVAGFGVPWLLAAGSLPDFYELKLNFGTLVAVLGSIFVWFGWVLVVLTPLVLKGFFPQPRVWLNIKSLPGDGKSHYSHN